MWLFLPLKKCQNSSVQRSGIADGRAWSYGQRTERECSPRLEKSGPSWQFDGGRGTGVENEAFSISGAGGP